MRKLIRAAAGRVNRHNAAWLLKTTAQSWGLQAALVVLLAATGASAWVAVVQAKLMSYGVWLGQVWIETRGE